MPTDNLEPVPRDEFLRALTSALWQDGPNKLLAEIVAEHLAKHLEASGFVILKKPS
jgi:hypothetical protein